MATLNVTITESLTINGKDQGGTYSGFSNSSITQCEKRQINVTTTEVTLYAAADAQASGTGGAIWDDDSVKYVRITNLAANSNHIIIVVKNADNDEFLYKLFGTESLLLYRHDGAMHAKEGSATAIGEVASIDLVTAQAVSSTQAVELFIASTNAA